MTLIVSVDPGKTTGISVVRYTPDTAAEVLHAQFVDYADSPTSVRAMLSMLVEGTLFHEGLRGTHPGEPIIMVVERFVPERSAHGFDSTPIEVIGEIRADLRDKAPWTTAVTAWHWPLRGAKEMVTGDVLRRLNLWQTRKKEPRMRHVNDALRHTVGYLVRVGHKPTERKGWPNEAKFSHTGSTISDRLEGLDDQVRRVREPRGKA